MRHCNNSRSLAGCTSVAGRHILGYIFNREEGNTPHLCSKDIHRTSWRCPIAQRCLLDTFWTSFVCYVGLCRERKGGGKGRGKARKGRRRTRKWTGRCAIFRESRATRAYRRSLVFPSTFILYYNSIRHGECRIRDRQTRLSMCLALGQTDVLVFPSPFRFSRSAALSPRTCSWL